MVDIFVTFFVTWLLINYLFLAFSWLLGIIQICSDNKYRFFVRKEEMTQGEVILNAVLVIFFPLGTLIFVRLEDLLDFPDPMKKKKVKKKKETSNMIKKPTTVTFRTKDGKKMSFPATRYVMKPTRAIFPKVKKKYKKVKKK